ncbi:MAG TPA: DUF3006 domain-containing protein [Anaerolineae bacterium]|nr:DUF3006 domain-containing protein [Anaerolineae bacterium]
MDSNTSANAASPAASRRGVIDQFEGDLAVIVFDDNEQLVVARTTLPPTARAGDVVMVSVPKMTGTSAQALSAAPTIEVDAADTAASQERIRNLLDDIFKK